MAYFDISTMMVLMHKILLHIEMAHACGGAIFVPINACPSIVVEGRGLYFFWEAEIIGDVAKMHDSYAA
eukprot:7993969-Ditylum_brightwellii.AAC.2